MTESDWQTCADPARLLGTLARQPASDRKLRLFCCACYRSVRWSPAVVRVAERYADGKVKPVSLRNAIGQVGFPTVLTITEGTLASQIYLVLADVHRAGRMAVPTGIPHTHADVLAERGRQVAFLRDIFGNPFRPVAVDPGWLTSTVVALAEGIYAEKAFDRMPFLADALQDAGCEHPDILTHCRGDGPHVRGCWVVDLVLGKV